MVHNYKNEETKLQTKYIVYNWGKFWTLGKKNYLCEYLIWSS
jgi:hypothetical protein